MVVELDQPVEVEVEVEVEVAEAVEEAAAVVAEGADERIFLVTDSVSFTARVLRS